MPDRVAAERVARRRRRASATGAPTPSASVFERARSRTPTAARRSRGSGARSRMRVDDAAQERGAVLERPAVRAGPVDRAEQLVQQVAVAVLHVDEVEARRRRRARPRRRKSSTSASRSSSESTTRRVGRRRAGRARDGGTRCAAATRRSGRDQRPECVSCRPTTRPSSLPVRGDVRVDQLGAQRGEVVDGRRGRSRAGAGWRARRARTATASPPQTSLAPLSPKRRHRRRTRSVGCAVGVAVPALHRAAPRTGCRPCACRPSRR